MSNAINHDVFGRLEIETENDKTKLTGKITIGDSDPCELVITGANTSIPEAILDSAAKSHGLFVARMQELRERAVRDWADEDQLTDVKDAIEDGNIDIAELGFDPSTIEGAIRNYRNLTLVCYHTSADEFMAMFEDETGLLGVDVTINSDLAFTEIEF